MSENGGYARGDPMGENKLTRYVIRGLMRVILELERHDATPVIFVRIPKPVMTTPEEPFDTELFVKLSALSPELRTQVRAELDTLKAKQIVAP